MIDLRFSTALQAVLMIAAAEADGIRATSGTLAEGLGVAPSFVRRLLTPLSHARIIVTMVGPTGGLRLARPVEAITLREVYEAAVEEKKLWVARKDVPTRCFVSKNITPWFGGLALAAENEALTLLGRQSLANALSELRALEASRLVGNGLHALTQPNP